MDLTAFSRRRTVRLLTRGRRSGQPRAVRLWFVVTDPQTLYVQHTSPRPAHWYRNLVETPAVEIDFGCGPLPAHAEPISDRAEIDLVLSRIRRKYVGAWIFRLLGWNRGAVAARIRLAAVPSA